MRKVTYLAMLAICIECSPTSAFCQRPPIPIQTNVPSSFTAISSTVTSQSVDMSYMLGKRRSEYDSANVDGSPYLSKEYNVGTIVTNNGIRNDNVPMRFDILHNELQVADKGKEFAVGGLLYAAYLTNPNDSATLVRFLTGFQPVDGNNKETIYNLLAGGKKVYLIRHVSQKLMDKRTVGYVNKKEIVSFSKYYIYTNEAGMKPVQFSARSLSEALPDKQDRIEKIIADHKLNIKKEKDFIKLINELDKTTE